MNKTIAELLIAFTIMSGGTALAVDRYQEILPAARDVSRAANAHQISVALELYVTDRQSYPVYTGTDAVASWEALRQVLEGHYVQELPKDPIPEHVYRYWSDGVTAKVFYFSETEGKELVRLNF